MFKVIAKIKGELAIEERFATEDEADAFADKLFGEGVYDAVTMWQEEKMNRDKQIEEMAKDLCHTDTCEIKKIGIPCNHKCKAHIYATRAIDKGYRKASDVASEIFEEIENAHDECIHIDPTTNIGYLLKTKFLDKLAELKKKYTEDME